MLPGLARAVDLEGLVMPGPVAAAHAKVESECSKCHTPFAKQSQPTLCLACHKPVGEDIRQQRGFHGLFEPARNSQCATCHTDHKGRSADITRLDRETFNHKWTDYPLTGMHQRTACGACHQPATKLRDAPSECVACHRKDDIHKKSLGEKCATCHQETGWRDAKFDHDKATKYPLTGAHAKVQCALCHAGEQYKDTPTKCVTCHRINDAHKGTRGEVCQDCHTTSKWKESIFDHAKAGKFPLTGDHARITCVACHIGNDFKKKLGRDCLACHRSDDAHQGRNGAKCETCHNTKSWKEIRFDHGRETKFPLRGSHEKLLCGACHKGPVYTVKLQIDCKSCHAADDVHADSLGGDCASCHSETSWRAKIAFDHALTRFPLAGLHATVACELCHVDKKFKGTPLACVECHQANDVHKASLGRACETCHNPNDWRIWSFDHNSQTHFALTGAHVGLQCAVCHTRPMKQGKHLASQCVDCHRSDDVHVGQFGGDCARCHDSTSFSVARRRN